MPPFGIGCLQRPSPLEPSRQNSGLHARHAPRHLAPESLPSKLAVVVGSVKSRSLSCDGGLEWSLPSRNKEKQKKVFRQRRSAVGADAEPWIVVPRGTKLSSFSLPNSREWYLIIQGPGIEGEEESSRGAAADCGTDVVYQPPLVVEGELGLEPLSQVKATSAASSFALLRFLPSYQYLALCTEPCTVTRLDHAVRPPGGVISSVARDTWLAPRLLSRRHSPRLSDTIWKTGAAIWYS